MVVLNIIPVFVFIGSVIFIVAYFLKRGGVNLFTKGKVMFFSSVIILYTVSPFIYRGCSKSYEDLVYVVLNYKYVVYGIFLITSAILIYSWVRGSLLNKSRSVISKIFSAIGIMLILGIIFPFTFIYAEPYQGIGGGAAHVAYSTDRQRSRDINSLQGLVEFYFKEHGEYPASLEELDKELESDLSEYKDPVTNEKYDYATSEDLSDYVLRTKLGVDSRSSCEWEHLLQPIAQTGNERTLESFRDKDGTIYGLDCNDEEFYYCVGVFE